MEAGRAATVGAERREGAIAARLLAEDRGGAVATALVVWASVALLPRDPKQVWRGCIARDATELIGLLLALLSELVMELL